MPEVRGRSASAEEERVAISLDKLGHRWDFQFEVFTITGVKGSYVIDFLVFSTVPFPTPLEVFGEFWHSADISSEDQLRLQRIEFELGPNINETVIIFGKEAQTQEDADDVLLRKIGRA